jgi:protein-S-isoprenylcysteine O-methyltransferase Ste14
MFRLMALANLALCVPIGLYFRIKSATRERLARRDEGFFIMIGLRLSGVIGLLVLAAYLIDPSSVSWLTLNLPSWLRWIGAGLGVTLVPALLFWTFSSLGANLTDTVVTRQTHTLITHGPYRWVRHPFYGLLFLWGLSLSLLTANWLLALLGLAAITMLAARTQTEEAKLIERFGDEYRVYARRTGKFFPRLTNSDRPAAD